jgi:hypothetical protein
MQFQPYQTGSWDLSHRGPHRLGAPFVSQGSSPLQQLGEPALERHRLLMLGLCFHHLQPRIEFMPAGQAADAV